MNRFLSQNLWSTISKLAKKSVKRAAIAYVSSDEHIQFVDGDLLVCDASRAAIKAGQTSAAVLKRAFDKNARIYTLSGLHAKIILLNEKALIGSANASASSANDLIEAGLLTDQPAIVVLAQSFVSQLANQATLLTKRDIDRLLSIKVVKQRFQGSKKIMPINPASTGRRTWIIGTIEVDEYSPEDQKVIERTKEDCLQSLSNPRSTVSTLRWTGNSRFRTNCQQGDWVIQTWRPQDQESPTHVYERMPILTRKEVGKATLFFYEEFPATERRCKVWSEFEQIAVHAGIRRTIKPSSQFTITEAQADAVQALWRGE